MDTLRRDFLRFVGFGAAGTLATPLTSSAERRRILGPGQSGGLGREVSPDVHSFLAGIHVGDAARGGATWVFWLESKMPGGGVSVATLEEARTRGDLFISERDQATVPALIVENRGKSPVLLLAGEILLGGKQHRVLSEDVLLPPGSGPRDISVYCVEQGRWTGQSKTFDADGSFAAPRLRAQVMRKAEQASVWAEVDKYSHSVAAPSPTHSYRQVYEAPEVKEHLKDVMREIDRPPAGSGGAAVFVSGALAGLDVFAAPDLFAREWPKLLRAHAVESYGRRPHSGSAERSLREQIDELLRDAAGAEGTLHSNTGLGQLFDFAVARYRGSALLVDRQVIHAAIL